MRKAMAAAARQKYDHLKKIEKKLRLAAADLYRMEDEGGPLLDETQKARAEQKLALSNRIRRALRDPGRI